MARCPLLLVGLLGLLLAGGLAVVALAGPLDREPVYTVAQVQAQLAHRPAVWIGRTIRIRGQMDGCPGILTPAAQAVCLGWDRAYLSDTTAPATAPLLVERGTPGPLLAALRRLPVLGALLPAAQALHWEIAATYRVRLSLAPAASCYRTLPCYAALLLDATSGEG
jgi:hypothetical protein